MQDVQETSAFMMSTGVYVFVHVYHVYVAQMTSSGHSPCSIQCNCSNLGMTVWAYLVHVYSNVMYRHSHELPNIYTTITISI